MVTSHGHSDLVKAMAQYTDPGGRVGGGGARCDVLEGVKCRVRSG